MGFSLIPRVGGTPNIGGNATPAPGTGDFADRMEGDGTQGDSSGSGLADLPAAALQGVAQQFQQPDEAQKLQAAQDAPHSELVQYFVNMGLNPATAVQLSSQIATLSPPPQPIANGVKLQPGKQNLAMVDRVRLKQAEEAALQKSMAVPEVMEYQVRNQGRQPAPVSAPAPAPADKPKDKSYSPGPGVSFSVDEWNSLDPQTRKDLVIWSNPKAKKMSKEEFDLARSPQDGYLDNYRETKEALRQGRIDDDNARGVDPRKDPKAR